MSEFTLQRHVDVSKVSGTGEVAFGVEFPDGAVAVRWPGEHPSTAAWSDIRDVEAIHGHEGATVVAYLDKDRLLSAYQVVMPYLLTTQEHMRPLMVSPHPDHPDRLRIILLSERAWKWWIALLDGSSDTAVHEEVDGEMQHRWVSPDGDIWCIHHTPTATSSDPEEDR